MKYIVYPHMALRVNNLHQFACEIYELMFGSNYSGLYFHARLQLHLNHYLKRAGEAGIALRARRGDSIYFARLCASWWCAVLSGRATRCARDYGACAASGALCEIAARRRHFWRGLVSLYAVILKADHLHA